MPLCPICNRPVAPRQENRAFPFCSARCRQVDLGKWLNEDYRVPVTDDSDEDGEGSAGPNGAGGSPKLQPAPQEKE